MKPARISPLCAARPAWMSQERLDGDEIGYLPGGLVVRRSVLGGMWGGMWPLAGVAIYQWGIGTGIAVVVIIYAVNAAMSGRQTLTN